MYNILKGKSNIIHKENKCTNKNDCMNEWVNGWMSERKNEQSNEQTIEWMNQHKITCFKKESYRQKQQTPILI